MSSLVVTSIFTLQCKHDHHPSLMSLLKTIFHEIVVHPVDFEHGGEISQPRIRKVDYCGDMEEILINILDEFLIK